MRRVASPPSAWSSALTALRLSSTIAVSRSFIQHWWSGGRLLFPPNAPAQRSRARETADAGLASRLTTTQRLAAVSSIRSLLGGLRLMCHLASSGSATPETDTETHSQTPRTNRQKQLRHRPKSLQSNRAAHLPAQIRMQERT